MRRAALAVALLVVFALAGTSAASAPRPVRNGRIVFVGPGVSLPPQPTLLAVAPNGRSLRWLGRDGDVQPRFAPNGERLAFVRTGGDKAAIYSTTANDRNERLVTPEGHDPLWSPDGRRLALSNGSLYVVDADGSGLRIVAQEGDPEVGVSPLHPTWSPDGTHLAFEAHFFHDFRRPDGNYLPRDDELRVVDLATGSIRRLTDYSRRLDWNRGFSDTSPAWSPDGRLIAFVHDTFVEGAAGASIEVLDAATGTTTKLAPVDVHPGGGDGSTIRTGGPVWSPDGTCLAVTDYAGTKVIRLRDRRVLRVAPRLAFVDAPYEPPAPAWSPDGKRLALVFSPNARTPRNLYTVSAGGGRLTQVTHLVHFSLSYDTPTWSSDGRVLAASADPHGSSAGADLLSVSPSGGAVRRVTATTYLGEGNPAFSRSGRLAFDESAVDGSSEVAVRGARGRRTIVAAGRQPSWSPDGRRLVYARDGVLYVRAVRGGPERAITKGPLVASDPAWSPDGRLVAFTARRAIETTIDTVRPNGSGLRVVARGPPARPQCSGQGALQPAWSPDGRVLAFVVEIQRRCTPYDDFGVSSLVTMRRNGTRRKVVVDGAAYVPRCAASAADVICGVGAFEPTWSPDGRRIAFALQRPLDRRTIAVVPAAGGRVHELVGGDAPAWQPVR